MELDELKNTWLVLDEQLKKNEMLNKRIIQEMLYKKSNKSLSWLMNTEFSSIIILPLVILLCIWQFNEPRFQQHALSKILIVAVLTICILGIIWQSYKILKYLVKINFSKSIKDNIKYVNKYAILIKKEKIMAYFVVIPVFSLFGIFYYYELKVNFSYWIFLIIVLSLATIAAYWSYKKIYDANIQSIKKSLEELNELKEE